MSRKRGDILCVWPHPRIGHVRHLAMTDLYKSGPDSPQDANFALGIDGFTFADLFDAVRLKDLAERFYADVADREPVLSAALNKYIAARGENYDRKVESKILTDAAPFLSDFIARLFNVSDEKED